MGRMHTNSKEWLCFRALFVFFLSLLLFSRSALSAQVTEGVGSIAVPSGVNYRDSWAIVIGINRYLKAPRLNYAVNDAQSVVAAVQQLGFASDKILLLLDREATKQRIEQVLYGTLRKASPEDRVLVFFAGHGLTLSLPRGGEEGYLLPVDGDPEDLPLTAIAMEELSRMARRVPAKHILFAVDACYSGFAITRDVAPARVDSFYLQAVTKEPAVQIITAGRKGEPVLEEEGHGLFTRRLLNGLTGLADTDQNGIITAQELATWLESRVVRDSQNRQHPQYSRLDGEGQFVFVMPRKAEATAAVEEREQRIKEELRRLANEAERLRERAFFEEQRKFQAERDAFLAERKKFDEDRKKAESARAKMEKERKIELARLEAEQGRLKAEEERVAKEKIRLEADGKRPPEGVSKAAAPEAIAKLPSQTPPRLPSPMPTVAEVPKYQVGDSWTVRFADGRTQTRKVRAIEKDQYVFEWGLDLWRYLGRDLVLRRQITPEDGKEYPSYLEKQRVMDFPLSVNKSWEFRIFFNQVEVARPQRYVIRYWRVFSFKVLGAETIQTSAGAFGAFKIEESSYEEACTVGPCETVANTTIIRHLWYAPEAKFPVKVAHVRGGYIAGQEPDYELVAFDLK